MKIKATLFSFSAFFLLLTLMVSGQETSVLRPEVRDVPAFAYFCLHHKGPISDIQDVIGRLIQAMKNQNLYPTGPMVGIYFTHPEATKPEDMEWEVGFPVMDQTIVQSPLEKNEWSYTMVATAMHVGPYEAAHQTIQDLMTWMEKTGYVIDGPVMERYLNNPMQVKPEELRTEIWIPCRKK